MNSLRMERSHTQISEHCDGVFIEKDEVYVVAVWNQLRAYSTKTGALIGSSNIGVNAGIVTFGKFALGGNDVASGFCTVHRDGKVAVVSYVKGVFNKLEQMTICKGSVVTACLSCDKRVFYMEKEETNVIKCFDLLGKKVDSIEMVRRRFGGDDVRSSSGSGKVENVEEIKLFIAENEENVMVGDRTLYEISGCRVAMYDVDTGAKLRTVVHPLQVLCGAAVSGLNQVAIGDVKGKITTYFFPDREKQKVVTSTEHWHYEAVNSLCYTKNGTELVSGGNEGVLVFWHRNTNQTNFCPRLGASVRRVVINKLSSMAAVLLGDNSVRFIQLHNYAEIARVTSLAPFQVEARNIAGRVAGTDYVMLPGAVRNKLQFVACDGKSQRIVGELVTRGKNYSKDSANGLRITHAVSSPSGRWIMTVEQTPVQETVNCDEFARCVVKVWRVVELGQFVLKTLVENPHHSPVCGLFAYEDASSSAGMLALPFVIVNDYVECFVTSGGDGSVMVWGSKEVERPSGLSKKVGKKVEEDVKGSEEKVMETTWSCVFLTSYRREALVGVVAVDKTLVLLFTHTATFWDGAKFRLKSVSQLGEGVEARKCVEMNGQLLVATTKGLLSMEVSGVKQVNEWKCVLAIGEEIAWLLKGANGVVHVIVDVNEDGVKGFVVVDYSLARGEIVGTYAGKGGIAVAIERVDEENGNELMVVDDEFCVVNISRRAEEVKDDVVGDGETVGAAMEEEVDGKADEFAENSAKAGNVMSQLYRLKPMKDVNAVSLYVTEKAQSMIPMKFIFDNYVKGFDATWATSAARVESRERGGADGGDSHEKVIAEGKSVVKGKGTGDEWMKRLGKEFEKAFPHS